MSEEKYMEHLLPHDANIGAPVSIVYATEDAFRQAHSVMREMRAVLGEHSVAIGMLTEAVNGIQAVLFPPPPSLEMRLSAIFGVGEATIHWIMEDACSELDELGKACRLALNEHKVTMLNRFEAIETEIECAHLNLKWSMARRVWHLRPIPADPDGMDGLF